MSRQQATRVQFSGEMFRFSDSANAGAIEEDFQSRVGSKTWHFPRTTISSWNSGIREVQFVPPKKDRNVAARPCDQIDPNKCYEELHNNRKRCSISSTGPS
jgi:hypothetical protein